MSLKNIVRIALLVFSPLFTFSQEAAIVYTNMQIYASLNDKPVAWSTPTVEIHLNKVTGEFTAVLLVDYLHLALTNPDYTGPTGENKGKFLMLHGVIPIYDVLDNSSSVMNLSVELTANFNDIDYRTPFTFSILRKSANNEKGFSVMSKGSLSISQLGITNLKQFDDELGIALDFAGY